jgi:hypothetical protein
MLIIHRRTLLDEKDPHISSTHYRKQKKLDTDLRLWIAGHISFSPSRDGRTVSSIIPRSSLLVSDLSVSYDVVGSIFLPASVYTTYFDRLTKWLLRSRCNMLPDIKFSFRAESYPLFYNWQGQQAVVQMFQFPKSIEGNETSQSIWSPLETPIGKHSKEVFQNQTKTSFNYKHYNLYCSMLIKGGTNPWSEYQLKWIMQ